MARCTNPISLKTVEFPVPCSKCKNCRANRVSGWSFRLSQELKRSENAFFMTYTYDTDNVPIVANKTQGYMTLKKEDVQLYFKRLRKLTGQGIKYYLCGEYGGKTLRPHYHAIIFNVPLDILIGTTFAHVAKQQPDVYLNGKHQFEHHTWGKGAISIGLVTLASIGYVLEYMSKPKQIPMHKNDNRLPEFSLMSKKLGNNYINQEIIQWHKNQIVDRYYVPLENGKKGVMPRYYSEKVYNQEEKDQIKIRQIQREHEEYQKLTRNKRKMAQHMHSKKSSVKLAEAAKMQARKTTKHKI